MLRSLFASIAASALAAAVALSAGCGGSTASPDSHPDAATQSGDDDSGFGTNPGHGPEAGPDVQAGDAEDGDACSCGIPFPVAQGHEAGCEACVASKCASAVSQCSAVCCPASDDTCANGGMAPLAQCLTTQCAADCSPCDAYPTLPCTTGATGYACTPGSKPTDVDPTLSCSAPTGANDVCCFAWTFGSAKCIPKDTFDGVKPACPGLSYGFECSAGSTPSAVDPALTCGAGTPDVGGTSDYCCTLH